ncbi:hypothetical protein JHK87_039077 [Glycine soja]|nr:hypothetical protein JHK87_039077 [Glycine soja]
MIKSSGITSNKIATASSLQQPSHITRPKTKQRRSNLRNALILDHRKVEAKEQSKNSKFRDHQII